MKYDEGIRKYRDTICVMDYAVEKGIEKGRAEGRKEATLANALSLKKNGVPVEIIANSLGLAIEDVQKL